MLLTVLLLGVCAVAFSAYTAFMVFRLTCAVEDLCDSQGELRRLYFQDRRRREGRVNGAEPEALRPRGL